MIWDNNDDIRLIECENNGRVIQRHLNECREERRPYVFVTSTMTVKPLNRLLVPVSMLVTHIKAVSEKSGEAISYEVIEARKDSFKLMQEAAERQRDFHHDLLILTASRDYGLDDILFGPPERHAIRKSLVPVMLVNPREDLFSLCD